MTEGFQSEAAGRPLSNTHLRPPSVEDTDPMLPLVTAAPATSRGARNPIWEIVETLLLALLIFVAVRSVMLNFRVDGLSMEPTLDSGQMLLVNRQIYFHFDANRVLNILPFVDRDGKHIIYPFHPPQRGDIVVLHPPVDQGKPYIKRVIGLPGERIAVHDGAVYINGERLEESYLQGIATSWPGSLNQDEYVVPDDSVFVMGDNRNNSTDSRVFGPVKIDEIIGKAWISYWPRSHLDIMTSPEYP